MESILIKTVRIDGFRGLKNVEINLERTTVLTGMNNSGKTSLLKALQIVFGNRQFLSQDDFHRGHNDASMSKIIIDVLIVPDNADENRNFSEDWFQLFGVERVKTNNNGDFIPLRTTVSVDPVKDGPIIKQYILPEWENEQKKWYELENGPDNNFRFPNIYDAINFHYIDAKRDILEDMKLKNSYIGKILSKIEYAPDDIESIETQIQSLNDATVEKSEILKIIKDTLSGLDSAIDTKSGGIEITPFTKKLRDLSKGLTINYGDRENSFSMDYHGMGTRSWSSLLTMKAFINIFKTARKSIQNGNLMFFPIVAIEEPESHLHPNAQRKLYSRIDDIFGQKIVSTHSPYIAASADIREVRSLYKDDGTVKVGRLDIDLLNGEDKRKIERQVINTRGEIFFSKCLILCEGETEEQALPIFFEEHFEQLPYEYGVNVIGISGNGNYFSFIRFAEEFHIPWVILSDGEDRVIKKLEKDLKQFKPDKGLEDFENIFIFENGANFEQYLLDAGYIEQIKKALININDNDENYLDREFEKKHGNSTRIKTDETCPKCEQPIYKEYTKNYDGHEGYKIFLLECMKAKKTQFAPEVARLICENGEIPPKIKDLFKKITQIINFEKQL